MNKTIHPDFVSHTSQIDHIITHFSTEGTLFTKGRRNTIRVFDMDGQPVNVKAFGIPNIFNKIAYRFLRSSKAQRSYEYATILLQKGIGTPQPIAFYENKSGLSFKDSYYMSAHMTPDLTYRQLIEIPDYPEHEMILRQFTQFTFMLHEKGVEFKDHTPGNTLIDKVGHEKYEFFLVDLNRMSFHTEPISLEKRVINMAKLTPERHLIDIMCDEYSKLYGCTYEELHKLMVKHTQYFANRFHRKRRIKRALGLRKK